MAPNTHTNDDVKDLDLPEQPADASQSVPAIAPAPEVLDQIVADSGSRGPAVTENLLLSFDQCVSSLSRQIKHGGDTLKLAPTTVKLILGRNRYNEPMWPRRFCSILGEIVTFRTFVEFVEKSPPRGLGTTVQMLKNVCRDDTEALDIIDQAVQKPDGKPAKTGNNVTSLGRPEGNSRDKALRRLRDHRPDLHAQVLSRELSAHAAMIEAGFRTRSFTVPDDIDAAAPILRRRFADRLPALIPALSATDVETHPNAEVANGGAELDMLAKMPLVIEPSEAPSMCEAKEISEKAGPAASQERIGRVPRQREAVPKRQHAPANHTLATDRRVEDVVDRLAALSAEERALVAGVMVDRWGTAEAPAASDEDDDESSLHAQCLDLAALKSGWTDVIVAMAITRVIGTALYAPDAPKIPAPDQTTELIKTLKKWLDQLQGTVEAQRARDSIIVNAVANGAVSASETAGVPVDNGNDAPALDRLASDNADLKYYPSTDPYNQQGVVWVKGALELEAQLAIAVTKLNKIPKPFIDETLERNSRLFEMLEGHRLPAVIDGLVRCYGYGDVANRLEAIALPGVSGPDPTPLSDRQS